MVDESIKLAIEIGRKGKRVKGVVAIKDGIAITSFSDDGSTAKEIYDFETSKGTKLMFDKEKNAIVQIYHGCTKEQILLIIKKELGLI